MSLLAAATAADLVARFGMPATLIRRIGAFDAATQATLPAERRVAIRAVLRDRSRLDPNDRYVTATEAIVAAAGLADPPCPGDRLAVAGRERTVVAVETLAAGAAPVIHILRLGR
ncbi:MAG: hypothetical protein AB7P02_25575 [Alphaproteobacteria bacterium]